MSLLPVYYTTNNLKKRRKKKSYKQLQAEKNHREFISSYISGGGRTGYTADCKSVHEGSSPSRQSNLPPCSDVIPTGIAYKKKHTDHNFTIAPAYNKGSYQVISRKDVKDIGK